MSDPSAPDVQRLFSFANKIGPNGVLVSVGRVTVGPGGGDAFSRPDYRVEIRRMDRTVEQRVSDLSDRVGGREAESACG